MTKLTLMAVFGLLAFAPIAAQAEHHMEADATVTTEQPADATDAHAEDHGMAHGDAVAAPSTDEEDMTAPAETDSEDHGMTEDDASSDDNEE